MNVLGISGRYREAAAALAVDGRVTAAASEDSFVRVAGIGYAQTGGFPDAAVDACLERAGLTPAQVDHVTVVDAEGPDRSVDHHPVVPETASDRRRLTTATVDRIDAVLADALQTAASAEDVDTVLICSAQPPAIVAFAREGQRLEEHASTAGGDRLLSAARELAANLGVSTYDPYRSLDRLSVGGEPEFQREMGETIHWTASTGVAVDSERFSGLIGACAGRAPGTLADADSLNAHIQDTRRSLAASFTCHLAHVIRDAAENLSATRGRSTIALGGGLAANPRFNTELRRLVGDALLRAVVPEPVGRALGAALAAQSGDSSTARFKPPSMPRGAAAQLPGLALGPVFTEHDIKRTLDNCRLDYVYEPDWPRLLTRVSTMLSQGKVVAWFQGAMTFGPRVLGSRSVLCDPSGRYARLNLNEYLRHVPLDEPLPVVFAPSAAQECLTGAVLTPPSVIDATVKDEWRDRLVSALDWRRHVRVQAVGPAQAPELCELLERHFERTRVPALIETNLGGFGEPVACTPRDAVRTVYSSAIDALVIGRFLLMKDYWLLRSDGA